MDESFSIFLLQDRNLAKIKQLHLLIIRYADIIWGNTIILRARIQTSFILLLWFFLHLSHSKFGGNEDSQFYNHLLFEAKWIFQHIYLSKKDNTWWVHYQSYSEQGQSQYCPDYCTADICMLASFFCNRKLFTYYDLLVEHLII